MFLVFLIQFLLSIFLFKFFISVPSKYKVIDKPNEFLPDDGNTPTSGGIIFLIIGFISLIFFYFKFSENILLPNNFFILIGSFFFLGLFSYFDDNKPIHPIFKLFVQFLICYLCLTSLKLFEFPLPLKITMLFSVLIWVYIINISNFVDGSDGFLSIISLQYFFSILIFYHYNDLLFNLSYLAIITLTSSILGFLFFNKPKAKIFMGDVGSISIGFVIGYTFLEFFLKGHYAIVLSAFAYPITDCTITILKKIKDGYLPWARLFDYFFLKPIKANILNKNKIFKLNIVCNLIIFIITLCIIVFDLIYLFPLSYVVSFIFITIYKKLI